MPKGLSVICNNGISLLSFLKKAYKKIHCSPFIMLYLGSIGMEHVISESYYKRTILQRNYRKMTIVYHFTKELKENDHFMFIFQ